MTRSSFQLRVPLLSLVILKVHFSLLILSCGPCAAREEPGEGPADAYLPIWERRFIEGLAVSVVVAALLLICVCRRRNSATVVAAEGSREWHDFRSRSTAGPCKSDHHMSINPTMVRSPGTSPDVRHRSLVSPDSRGLSPPPAKQLRMLLALPVPAADERVPSASQPNGLPAKRPTEENAVIEDPFSTYSPASWVRPKELEYERLQEATNGFDRKSRLGQWDLFKAVWFFRQKKAVWFKGTNFVQDEGLPAAVAIKRFHETVSTELRERMLCDLSRMTTLRHKNVVSLLGYSFGKGRFHLVYSYMPNRSLDDRLFREPGGTGLIWPLRYTIVNDVARALYHLHVTNVPHGSIKASNVMLEQDFAAQLHEHFGYQPGQSNTPRGSLEADMMEFGVLILQVVCGRGRRPGLVDWVWALHGESRLLEAVDPAARGGGFDSAQANMLLLLALACTHPDPEVRLDIHHARRILSDQAPLPEVPLCKPT